MPFQSFVGGARIALAKPQPGAEMYGIQRIEFLDDVLILSGAGVGGGCHLYANTEVLNVYEVQEVDGTIEIPA